MKEMRLFEVSRYAFYTVGFLWMAQTLQRRITIPISYSTWSSIHNLVIQILVFEIVWYLEDMYFIVRKLAEIVCWRAWRPIFVEKPLSNISFSNCSTWRFFRSFLYLIDDLVSSILNVTLDYISQNSIIIMNTFPTHHIMFIDNFCQPNNISAAHWSNRSL